MSIVMIAWATELVIVNLNHWLEIHKFRQCDQSWDNSSESTIIDFRSQVGMKLDLGIAVFVAKRVGVDVFNIINERIDKFVGTD